MVGGNVANIKKLVPILCTQPPLPRAIAVRYVDVASNKDANTHQGLKPVGIYCEEEYPYSDYLVDPVMDDYHK